MYSVRGLARSTEIRYLCIYEVQPVNTRYVQLEKVGEGRELTRHSLDYTRARLLASAGRDKYIDEISGDPLNIKKDDSKKDDNEKNDLQNEVKKMRSTGGVKDVIELKEQPDKVTPEKDAEVDKREKNDEKKDERMQQLEEKQEELIKQLQEIGAQTERQTDRSKPVSGVHKNAKDKEEEKEVIMSAEEAKKNKGDKQIYPHCDSHGKMDYRMKQFVYEKWDGANSFSGHVLIEISNGSLTAPTIRAKRVFLLRSKSTEKWPGSLDLPGGKVSTKDMTDLPDSLNDASINMMREACLKGTIRELKEEIKGLTDVRVAKTDFYWQETAQKMTLLSNACLVQITISEDLFEKLSVGEPNKFEKLVILEHTCPALSSMCRLSGSKHDVMIMLKNLGVRTTDRMNDEKGEIRRSANKMKMQDSPIKLVYRFRMNFLDLIENEKIKLANWSPSAKMGMEAHKKLLEMNAKGGKPARMIRGAGVKAQASEGVDISEDEKKKTKKAIRKKGKAEADAESEVKEDEKGKKDNKKKDMTFEAKIDQKITQNKREREKGGKSEAELRVEAADLEKMAIASVVESKIKKSNEWSSVIEAGTTVENEEVGLTFSYSQKYVSDTKGVVIDVENNKYYAYHADEAYDVNGEMYFMSEDQMLAMLKKTTELMVKQGELDNLGNATDDHGDSSGRYILPSTQMTGSETVGQAIGRLQNNLRSSHPDGETSRNPWEMDSSHLRPIGYVIATTVAEGAQDSMVIYYISLLQVTKDHSLYDVIDINKIKLLPHMIDDESDRVFILAFIKRYGQLEVSKMQELHYSRTMFVGDFQMTNTLQGRLNSAMRTSIMAGFTREMLEVYKEQKQQ